MKINDLLKSIALQSGVNETEISAILENKALDLEIDDAISSRLTTPRLTMDAAKANPELKKHFTAQALNGIDAEVLRTIQELELDDSAKLEIESQETSYKKVSALAKKVKSLEAAKVNAGTGDKKTLNDQILALNLEIKTAKDSALAEKNNLLTGFENERIDWQLNSLLSDFNYALPKDTPKDAVQAFGRTLVNTAFTNKGLKIVKENGQLSIKTSEGTDYFENNVRVGLNDFVQKTLANAKVLSASPKGAAPQKQEVVHSQGNNTELNMGDFNAVMESSLSDLNN